jgi:dihydroflavonol-4-reductase
LEALITGATGFVGSHLADLLQSKGISCRCIFRNTSNLRWVAGRPYKLFEASLSDKSALAKAVEGVDYIFHVGGLIAARSQEEFLKANRDGTKNLLNVAFEYTPNLKRFLYVSSLTAAGPAKSLSHPVNEDMPCNPITAYGKSKAAAEIVVNEYSDKFPITIVRPPAIYGPRDPAMVPIFKSVKTGLGFLIGFKKKYLSLIHVEDLVRGIAEAAFSEKTINQTYYISSDEFYDWVTLMNTMKNAINKKNLKLLKAPEPFVMTAAYITEFFGRFMSSPPVFNLDKGRDFIQNYWICSTEKAKRDFGYTQQISIDAGMKNTFDWYIENKWI